MAAANQILKRLSNVCRALKSKTLDARQIYEFLTDITNTRMKYIVEIVVNLLSGATPITKIHKRSLKTYSSV